MQHINRFTNVVLWMFFVLKVPFKNERAALKNLLLTKNDLIILPTNRFFDNFVNSIEIFPYGTER